MAHKHVPAWVYFAEWLFPEDPPQPGAFARVMSHMPKPRLKTRIKDFLGIPRPPDEPKGFEWD